MEKPILNLETQLMILQKERDALLAEVKALRKKRGVKQMIEVFTK